MNDFLKSLTAFGMEGMNADAELEVYSNSECAEELIELDNFDNACLAMESMSDAIKDSAFEMQTLALESAGFTLDTASGFTGELSNEAVVNMVKRGYYEVKIQVKKVLQKIWKLILSVVDQAIGSSGRLKSYGKLFKKYRERLSKVNPKETKDGDDREVTIRDWSDLVQSVKGIKALAGDSGWIRTITTKVKSTNVKECIQGLLDGCTDFKNQLIKFAKDIGGATDAEAKQAVSLGSNLASGLSRSAAETIEKEVAEALKDVDGKEFIKEIVSEIKDIESDDVTIWKAKEQLLGISSKLEDECKKDLKFKKELIKLRKAWDKKTGEFNLNGAKDSQGNPASEDLKAAIAAVLRTLNMFGPVITGYRIFLSKVYSAVASNLQGCLADMAKVIAKGTNIRSN